MKNKFIYLIIIIISFGCNLQKSGIRKERYCLDEKDDIFGELKFTLDTTHIKNIDTSKTIFFENDTLRKSIELYNPTIIVVTIDNKIYNRSKWLYYKNLKLFKEREVFKFKYIDDYYGMIYINKAKYYNKNNEVVKTEDYCQKEKYPICYRGAYNIVKKWKPKRYDINGMSRDSIVNKKDTIYTWQVHITPRNFKGKTYLYIINAKNGKKIKKIETKVTCGAI